MGLFDKKYCDICGEKIGLLGNRKLENGTTVTHQYPDGGAKVPAGTTVYLYTESTEDIQ